MTPPKATPAQIISLGCLTALTMIGGSLTNRALHPGPLVRIVLALVPMIPACAMGWAIIAAIRGLDELQRRIVLEALSGSLATGAFLTLLYGQLQQAHIGLPDLNWAFAWAAMVVPCAIAYLIAARQYR